MGQKKFDIIVSNPPYIAIGDPRISVETQKHEPSSSLYATNNGLGAYEMIAAGARGYLNENGRVLVEIGQGQEKEVTSIFSNHGFELEKSKKDLCGIIRCLIMR